MLLRSTDSRFVGASRLAVGSYKAARWRMSCCKKSRTIDSRHALGSSACPMMIKSELMPKQRTGHTLLSPAHQQLLPTEFYVGQLSWVLTQHSSMNRLVRMAGYVCKLLLAGAMISQHSNGRPRGRFWGVPVSFTPPLSLNEVVDHQHTHRT